MTRPPPELMTPDEAAEWFRRSTAWLRAQRELLRMRSANGQPLFHVRVCRAYVLGKLCGLDAAALRATQLQALAADCCLPAPPTVEALAGAEMDAARPAVD